SVGGSKGGGGSGDYGGGTGGPDKDGHGGGGGSGGYDGSTSYDAHIGGGYDDVRKGSTSSGITIPYSPAGRRGSLTTRALTPPVPEIFGLPPSRGSRQRNPGLRVEA
ncbi:unnamed protein product, partial [Phaeothamnion confervicola]